jgi:hypothetical protein
MGDENDPVAAVKKYIDAFNRGDAIAMSAAFAPESSILDGMAPHLWTGPTLPATMTFNAQGKQVTQTGAIFTVALRKLTLGWRIAAWAWAKGGQTT